MEALVEEQFARVPPYRIQPDERDLKKILHHLESAESDAQAASEGMRRSGEWLARVRTGLDQNYLAVEKRRLDAANAVLESARRSVAKAREELETTKNLLRERSRP